MNPNKIETTFVLKIKQDGTVIIESYDAKKKLLGINFGRNINEVISLLNIICGSQVIIKEAV